MRALFWAMRTTVKSLEPISYGSKVNPQKYKGDEFGSYPKIGIMQGENGSKMQGILITPALHSKATTEHLLAVSPEGSVPSAPILPFGED